MAVSFDLVDGPAFAERASWVLEQAWRPTALRYSPDYMHWQLSFPSPSGLPAAAAFDGAEPVGFAGVTARRIRLGSRQWDSGIVSFVAVRPQWQGRGVAAGLYRALLGALRQIDMPLVTFGVSGSGGERSLLGAYPQAGFRVRLLGTYPSCNGLARGDTSESDWEAETCEDTGMLAGIVEACALDEGLIWGDLTEAQAAHYLRDPRPRRLILLKHRDTGIEGAAWVVRSELRTPRGLETVTTVESLLLPRKHAEALPALLRRASSLWTSHGSGGAIVSAASLYGFEPVALRQAGIRQTGPAFSGYLCLPDRAEALAEARGTSLEVV